MTMSKILAIKTSLNGDQGNSNKLVDLFIQQWNDSSEIDVTTRDLSVNPVGHLTSEEMQAWGTEKEQRTKQQHELATISDDLVSELLAADALVIGMPMYNFGIPSVFKTWIDRVARAGVTFRYTETGPEGLLKNKKVYILAARGGKYAGTEKDSQSQYLKDVLAFLGLTEVEFVYVEGLAMGEEMANLAWQHADEKIIELIGNRAA